MTPKEYLFATHQSIIPGSIFESKKVRQREHHWKVKVALGHVRESVWKNFIVIRSSEAVGGEIGLPLHRLWPQHVFVDLQAQ